MRAHERFLNYVKVPTASCGETAGTNPSTQCQFVLAKQLVQEMQAMGISNARVDEKCYVYASIEATQGYEHVPAIGFIAHIDTSPDASGEGVKPIIHENYNGEDVHLPSGHVISTKTFPALKNLKGKTLITASGDTLLGADDKAGIAEILTAIEQLLSSGAAHGRICIGFTPDEEVGCGADGFDVEAFGAKYAYTVDGGEVNEVEYESFNAASAKLTFKGVEVHPGYAKDIMVSAARLAVEFDGMLPSSERPNTTEGREGFYHLISISGETASAQSAYIIRDHDKEIFAQRKENVRKAAAELESKYFEGCVQLEIEDSYYNMSEIVQQHFHLVENAQQAVRDVGLEPKTKPIRGGTDGSRLSFMGLPCPNLGTGGYYAHGPSECVTIESMDKAVQIVLNIIEIYAKQ